MEQPLIEIREQQKDSWNKFSAGWEKWDKLNSEFLKPMGDEIIRLIHAENDSAVLDIASGTGQPGLTIASKLKNGKVFLSDLSDDMLAIARRNAVTLGIKNVETKVCDVCELPFHDNSFNAISCRFGFMFFPDVLLAAKEMYRVLKPGSRVATAVWNGPEKNFWVTVAGGTINKNMNLSPPPPGAPGMFRCAEKDFISNVFHKAGFKNTSVKEVTSQLRCGTADVYWNLMTEVAAPFVAALSKADDAMKAKIKSEVFDAIHQKYSPGKVVFDASAWVIYGEK